MLALYHARRGEAGEIVFSRPGARYRLDFPHHFNSDAERLLYALGIYRHTYEELQRRFTVQAMVDGHKDSLDVQVFYEPLR